MIKQKTTLNDEEFFLKNGKLCSTFSILEIVGLWIMFPFFIFFIIDKTMFGDFDFNIQFLLIIVIGATLLGIGFLGTFSSSLRIVLKDKILVKNYNKSVFNLAMVTLFLGIFTGIALKKKISKIIQTNANKNLTNNNSMNQIIPNVQSNNSKKRNSFSSNLNSYQPLNEIDETKAALITGMILNQVDESAKTLIVDQEQEINNSENKQLDTQNSQNNNSIKLENLKTKLENLEKLKDDGFITDEEYIKFMKKFILES